VAIQSLLSDQGRQYKTALINYLAANRDLLSARIGALQQITLMSPRAGFLAWMDFRNTGLTHEAIKKKLIDDAGLGLNSGLIYGDPAGEGWFRLNFGIARGELEKAIGRLESVFG